MNPAKLILWVGTLLAGVFLISGCPGARFEPVDLAPEDPRPVLSVVVEDPTEVELLVQELELEPIGLEGNTLHFFDRANLRARLRDLGYTPRPANPQDVFHRVVRVQRRGEEERLVVSGVQIINREEEYWIVRGTLRQLHILRQLGYTIGAVGPDEPRPREVRIQVPTRQDVIEVGALDVDIYSVEETREGFTIYGGAFDFQIDLLRERDYTVERISTVDRG